MSFNYLIFWNIVLDRAMECLIKDVKIGLVTTGSQVLADIRDD